MTLRIDRRLHLIVPIYKDEEGGDIIAHVHSTPLAEEIVDQYFFVLGGTYSTIFSEKFGITSGPGHAMRILKHVATERGEWHDDPKTGRAGVERGLVEEMRRLTNVAAINAQTGKWEQLPLAVAVQQGVISDADRREVENAIVFFMVVSATLGRAQVGAVLKVAAGLWGAQVSSSSFTEFASSLRTSTATESTGARSPAPASGEGESAGATQGAKLRSVPY